MKVETIEEIGNRVLDLAENVDCGIFSPPMDAQTALNELCRFILGEDYYAVNPISQQQINTEIVFDIECKLRKYRWARREAKRIAKEGANR